MTTYNIKIKLVDGEEVILENVTGFSSNSDTKIVRVDFETGYRALFNMVFVKYIGRTFDLNRE